MSTNLALDTAMRAEPYSPKHYAAFRVVPGLNADRTYSCKPIEAGELGDALNEALAGQAFSHKDHLVIQETDDRGMRMHLFAIKRRSAPSYVYANFETKRVQPLYAAPLCVIDAGVVAGVAA